MVISVHVYIYIYTKYIKLTAFQASPVKKEKNKRLNFKRQASNGKFQAETRIKILKQAYDQISKPYEQSQKKSLEKQSEFRQIRLNLKSRLMRHRVKYSKS